MKAVAEKLLTSIIAAIASFTIAVLYRSTMLVSGHTLRTWNPSHLTGVLTINVGSRIAEAFWIRDLHRVVLEIGLPLALARVCACESLFAYVMGIICKQLPDVLDGTTLQANLLYLHSQRSCYISPGACRYHWHQGTQLPNLVLGVLEVDAKGSLPPLILTHVIGTFRALGLAC